MTRVVSAARDYERAWDRLIKITVSLSAENNAATLHHIKLASADRGALDKHNVEPAVVAEALAELIKADLPKYLTSLVHKAQDDVKRAGEALQARLVDDLNSNLMRD
jgi:hypothetical protein